jgi:hypothetical protein
VGLGPVSFEAGWGSMSKPAAHQATSDNPFLGGVWGSTAAPRRRQRVLQLSLGQPSTVIHRVFKMSDRNRGPRVRPQFRWSLMISQQGGHTGRRLPPSGGQALLEYVLVSDVELQDMQQGRTAGRSRRKRISSQHPCRGTDMSPLISAGHSQQSSRARPKASFSNRRPAIFKLALP